MSLSSHQIRIIGGIYKGKKLDVLDLEGLRPTPDRIRETIFNLLSDKVQAANVLDLFAGSGALGIEALSRGAKSVTLIEKDYDRCKFLAEELSNTLVINGDGTNLKLLDEEEIGSADVVISVTNNDEKNLLCSLLAKQLGVKRVIARVAKVVNIPLFEKVGIDIAVSPKNSAINEVKNDLQENDVDILATVEQGQGEVLEIGVLPEFKGQKIMDLRLPKHAIIGTIDRSNTVIIPNGTTELQTGDILIIFTKAEDALEIKQFFKVK